MSTKKESSTSDKKGVGAIPSKYVQEQMESGNPKPTADAPSKRRGSGKSSKKDGKK
ncbi:MAG: hypothetical protein H0W76_20835 [Pyrinomonadaceae bacterium]|nr:hypothetical protein [Pyrinomonadaceae bacterium]